MAKKSRRARKKKSRRHTTASTSGQPVPYAAPIVEIQAPKQAKSDFHEYQYVITDLKRVAILALAMFALLVALSFFIR